MSAVNCITWFTDTISCDCKTSQFCDSHHGHIVTGDLRFIKNTKLRTLLSKGPKYRENERINWQKVHDSITTGIDECKKVWSNKENVDIKVLNEWSCTLKNKISHIIKSKKKSPIIKKILNDKDIKNELVELHNNFVFVPTDKAQNNIVLFV